MNNLKKAMPNPREEEDYEEGKIPPKKKRRASHSGKRD